MHSFVTSKNAQWRRLIWPTLYVALLDNLRLSLECDALGVANNSNPWTENSQRYD